MLELSKLIATADPLLALVPVGVLVALALIGCAGSAKAKVK
jgi:hypothetical protein